MSSVSRPCLSTAQIRCVALWRSRPSRTIASRNWSAIPMPAVPAPKMTIRWSDIGVRLTRTALSMAPSTIAPVPCMSSLKVEIWPVYFSRMRRALDGPKSSQCSNALGNRRVATET
jgi:hypothetical protein